MSTSTTPPARLPGLLYLFALCNLVLGTGAFGLGGILEQVAADLKQPVQAVGQNMTAYAFATALLTHAKVAVVPGNAFMAEGYCRLSYAVSMANIREGLSRIEAFVKSLT